MTKEKYFDKNGLQIKGGMILIHDDGTEDLVYKTVEGDLGFNASNEEHVNFNQNCRELYPLYQFNLKEYKIKE